MALIHSKFDFADKPWWRPDYDDCGPQYFISKTKHLQQAILLSVNNDDELLWKGFMDLHRKRYLIECISAESNVDLDVIEQLLKKSWFKVFLDYVYEIIFTSSHPSYLAKKVQNVRDTIDDIFPSIFFPDLPVERFTPLFAKQLHQQVGNRLIDNAGQYRTRYVMASQDNFVYLSPNMIENKMEVLFRQCRENFKKEDLGLEEAVKFGACFLAHFLYIHPFTNGNGRVGRLLLSYLLSKFTVVPLSLYSGTKTRDVYLQCLREAQWFHEPPFKPSALASFILENIYATSSNICAVMDIDIQNNND